MLSPYKLLKHDLQNQRVRRTWGPKGKPYKGSPPTFCYSNCGIDWTIHRLLPAVYQQGKPGSKRRLRIERMLEHDLFQVSAFDARNGKAGHHLRKTSPRWGEGKVPSRMEGRKIVDMPLHKMQISKSTYVAAGVGTAAVVGGGGYYYYRRRKGKLERVKKNQAAAARRRARTAPRGQAYNSKFHGTRSTIHSQSLPKRAKRRVK